MPVPSHDDALRAASQLYEADKAIRILDTLDWPAHTKQEFFQNGAKELPVVEYPSIDLSQSLAMVEHVLTHLPDDPVLAAWLTRHGQAIARSAQMLSNLGTRDFFRYSSLLYGVPKEPLADHTRSPLELARELDKVISSYSALDLGAPDPACHTAQAIAEQLRTACSTAFGDFAPEILVVDQLSANALASSRTIKIRAGACFTDRDARQLIEHEALVHVLTALNGRRHPRLPLLSAGHAGTTQTQEGLAVFAELLSGNLDPSRLRRLADRVITIQMAIDGGDFLDIYRYHTERGVSEDQAYESARRVFRGGLIDGGAPFTKDCVYLDGLLHVHDFLCVAVQRGRIDCIRLLFCGKLDIEDMPALCALGDGGLDLMPHFLPPWVRDARSLVASLAYTAFVDRVDLTAVEAHYGELLDRAPRVA